ncbi:MAG: hypothetical protein HY841_15255 [Bacteroidetes bacterium]|nr:hypothetical protein [Bacteroidota bacterium]
MKYFKPDKVTSPSDYVENVQVIYDGGKDSFSLAKIIWEGTECFAIRWNVARREWDDLEKQNGKKMCVGMPSSHGYPVWFVLPNDLLNADSEIQKLIKKHI